MIIHNLFNEVMSNDYNGYIVLRFSIVLNHKRCSGSCFIRYLINTFIDKRGLHKGNLLTDSHRKSHQEQSLPSVVGITRFIITSYCLVLNEVSL